jgi:AcrR family transcriptional regulator
MTHSDAIRDGIVDTAIGLAERRSSWEAVRLQEVAAELNIPLDELRGHFRDKDEVAEAWFDRADGAMLAQSQGPGFVLFSPRERLQQLILAWLDALAPHRKVTRQMIYAKLDPGHIHLQLPALLRVSRTVQWLREAARRDTTYLRRALEETGLTAVYVTTFVCWMYDGSHDSERTRRALERNLKAAEWLDHCVYAGWPRTARRTVVSPTAHPAPEEPTV